jgi:hypothetical protein
MDDPFRPSPYDDIQDLPTYYKDFDDDDIATAFKNFDVERHFDVFDRKTRDPNSSNFCVDFGDDEAYCAFDLPSQSFVRLTQTPRPANLHTRWINIWMPYVQKDTLHALAQYYDFSPRLLGLMCSDPVPPKPRSLETKQSTATLRSRKSNKSKGSSKTSGREKPTAVDSEESIGMTDMMHSTQLEMIRDLSQLVGLG